jgi:hypothetical protein
LVVEKFALGAQLLSDVLLGVDHILDDTVDLIELFILLYTLENRDLLAIRSWV